MQGVALMPTILYIDGWRLFFYTNEGHEPPHIHCSKGGCDAKYWLNVALFDIVPAHEYNVSPADRKAVRKIIFTHFDYIAEAWAKIHGGGDE